eukprot:scaffold129327_cov65-Phaeocystis_antarctica.AAC.1
MQVVARGGDTAARWHVTPRVESWPLGGAAAWQPGHLQRTCRGLGARAIERSPGCSNPHEDLLPRSTLAHFPTLRRLPLARVNDAFALIEGRATMGKVVLEP